MPTREQAVEIIVTAREPIQALIADLTDKQLRTPTLLGGGAWSVKDLMGHLAGYEDEAAAFAIGRPRAKHVSGFGSVDERNAAEIERKRKWTVKRVRAEFDETHADLLMTIETMSDERWTSKVETGRGRSALGLVLGKMLVGWRFGLSRTTLRIFETSSDRL